MNCNRLGINTDIGDAAKQGLASEQLRIRLGRRLYAVPPWFTPAARRLPTGAARASWEGFVHYTHGMSLYLGIALALLAAGVSTGQGAVIALSLTSLIIVLSVLAHELGHILAYRLILGADAPAIAVVSGLSCGLVRLRGTPAKDALIIIAGPITPLLLSMPIWLLAGPSSFFALIWLLTAIGHFLSLILPIGDGASLRDLANNSAPHSPRTTTPGPPQRRSGRLKHSSGPVELDHPAHEVGKHMKTNSIAAVMLATLGLSLAGISIPYISDNAVLGIIGVASSWPSPPSSQHSQPERSEHKGPDDRTNRTPATRVSSSVSPIARRGRR